MDEETRLAYDQEAPDREFFASIPWVSKITSNPEFVYQPLWSRLPKASDEDAIFAETLKTATTVSHLVCYYRKPTSRTEPVRELIWFISVGPKLNGWIDLVHGGIQSFLLDEIMGCVLSASKRFNPEKFGAIATAVTGELKVRFLKRMETPGIYLVTARLLRVEGRKNFIESDIVDERGVVVAKGESVYIVLKDAGKL